MPVTSFEFLRSSEGGGFFRMSSALPKGEIMEPTVIGIQYSSNGARFCAGILDLLILSVLCAVANAVIPNVGAILVTFFYEPVLTYSELRGTIGKHLMGIEVVDLSGRKISFGASILRSLMKWVSTLLLLIGYIMILFTEKRQGLHDMVADTLVVKGRHDVSIAQAWLNAVKELFQMNSTSKSSQDSGSTLAELERLQALRDKGVLTEEEFQIQKAKILNADQTKTQS